MQYRTRVKNSACGFCNIVGVTDLHAMFIRLSKSDLLVDSRSYTLLFRKPQRKKSGGLRFVWGAPSFWYHMRNKSRTETSPSKKSANGPDKISVYDSDVKGPSKYIEPIKVLFHIPHHTFTDQRTWWRFGRNRCGFSMDQ
ncbi:uncharacterized protein TNCV_1266861 [Trichonephila clavipes]|nr:uncharacterized protein TNCV_1266861 [Trichonephila clavipes]